MLNVNSLNNEQKIALLYGIMAGDGCLSKYANQKGSTCYAMTITGSLEDDLLFFKEIVSPLLSYFRDRETNIRFRKDCGAIEFNFTDKKLFDLIKSFGFPIGKKGQKLIIPEFFFERNLVKYVIQGFMATDGSLVLTKNPNKFYPRIESVVIHKYFLKQVYDYMVSIGLKGAYYLAKSKPDPRWNTCQDKYRFQFNGKNNLLQFDKLIGFINPKHNKKFNDFLRYDKDYDYYTSSQSLSNRRIVRNKLTFSLKI